MGNVSEGRNLSVISFDVADIRNHDRSGLGLNIFIYIIQRFSSILLAVLLPQDMKTSFDLNRNIGNYCSCSIRNSNERADITVGIMDFNSEVNAVYIPKWVYFFFLIL